MNPQPKAEHMAMPKLMITKFGDIAFQDGRLLVEYDSTTDNEEELKQIVKAVNSFDELLEIVERFDVGNLPENGPAFYAKVKAAIKKAKA